MSQPSSRSLHPVPETDFDEAPSTTDPAPSRRSHVSPIKDFSPKNIFRRQGYQRMSSDHAQEMDTLDTAYRGASHNSSPPPQLPPLEDMSPDPDAQGLGIFGFPNPFSKRSSIRRVPVGTKPSNAQRRDADSPETPRSQHGLLSSNPASVMSTPMVESQGPSSTASQNVRRMGSWDHDGMSTVIGGASPGQYSDAPRRLLDTPATMVATPGTMDQGEGFSDNDEFDDELFYKGFGNPPEYCSSKGDVHARRRSWLSITIYLLSVYSTVSSGVWLIVAIIQPRWGYGISSRQGLYPSTATTLAALISKTIEMSFVTVFISFLGQVLTRRAFRRKTNGMTLGEMTMRNWVIQPGSLITHAETVPSAGLSLLGALALTATVAATFYTTASESMVAPKLMYGGWESREMSGYYRSEYANVSHVRVTCPSLLKEEEGNPEVAANSCLEVQTSGQSYRNLMNFMDSWATIMGNDADAPTDLAMRPAGTTLLFDNTTMEASWIETDVGHDVETLWGKYSRVVNNVSMAMPHPGVHAAATSSINGILQPDDLAGVGEYSIRAGVVAPSINVVCVNMSPKELEPLVYTAWPDADNEDTGVGDQEKGKLGWDEDVPRWTEDEYLNRTDADGIFRWGQNFGRRPPVFQMYPADHNMISNSSIIGSDSIYILGKKVDFDDYTLCELRSWLSPLCSTRFDISGTAGAHMAAHCEDDEDKDSYLRSFPQAEKDEFVKPSTNWKDLGDSWRLSMDINGGVYNNNASNARIITQLALELPGLSPTLPSMAEALAVYASSTLVAGSIDAPFRHYYEHLGALPAPGELQAFNASVRTQQYTSGHVNSWQSVFYVILVLVFLINLLCLVYFLLRSGLVTDFTEPQNLFALAVNSPPSAQLKGSCGAGPVKRDLVVPWRVAYAPSANHYFFEEADFEDAGRMGLGKRRRRRRSSVKGGVSGAATGVEYAGARPKGQSYKRLSSGNGWLYGF